MLTNSTESNSYLVMHFKESDDFLHVVAVEALQQKALLCFILDTNKK
jgi:hypothetical protein